MKYRAMVEMLPMLANQKDPLVLAQKNNTEKPRKPATKI